MDDSSGERYLINPYGIHWSQIEPESLLLIDGDGTVLEGEGEVEDTARFIHVAGHRANPRHKALFHTHMPYTTTLTMLEGAGGKLAMAHQTAIRFHGRTVYEDAFGGLAHDETEGERLAARAAEQPEADVIFLASHGVVVGGASVAIAFDDLYYLERASRQQVLAMQTGQTLREIPGQIVELTSRQIHKDLPHFADKHFQALAQVMLRNPDRVMTF